MSEPKFIDFQAIKNQVSIIQILEHYDLMGRLQQNGENATGVCPIHQSNGNIAFRANLTINFWNCFSQCGCSGDILDFVSRKEKVSLNKAARLIIRWFDLKFEPPITEVSDRPGGITPTGAFPCPASTATNRLSDATPSGGQSKFAVKRYWELCDTVYVVANSISEAIEAAHALPIDDTKAEFVPDSINSDPSCDVEPLSAQ